MHNSNFPRHSGLKTQNIFISSFCTYSHTCPFRLHANANWLHFTTPLIFCIQSVRIDTTPRIFLLIALGENCLRRLCLLLFHLVCIVQQNDSIDSVVSDPINQQTRRVRVSSKICNRKSESQKNYSLLARNIVQNSLKPGTPLS